MTSVGIVLIALGAWGALSVGLLALFTAHGERERQPRMTASCSECGRLFHAPTDEYTRAVNAGHRVTCGGCR